MPPVPSRLPGPVRPPLMAAKRAEIPLPGFSTVPVRRPWQVGVSASVYAGPVPGETGLSPKEQSETGLLGNGLICQTGPVGLQDTTGHKGRFHAPQGLDSVWSNPEDFHEAGALASHLKRHAGEDSRAARLLWDAPVTAERIRGNSWSRWPFRTTPPPSTRWPISTTSRPCQSLTDCRGRWGSDTAKEDIANGRKQ